MRKVRGFTLVELLVVIGIIALLIGILLPSLSKAQQASQALKCAANLKTMGLGLTMYLNEHRYYPGCHGTFPGQSPASLNAWAPRIRNMLGGRGAQGSFRCPSTDDQFEWKQHLPNLPIATDAQNGWGYETGEPVLGESLFQFSYGYNDWGQYSGPDKSTLNPYGLGLGGDLWSGPNAELPVSYVSQPSECIAIADVIAKPPTSGAWLSNIDPNDSSQGPSNRHRGGCNVMFADGHVEWKKQSEVSTFTTPAHSTTDLSYIHQLWNNDHQEH